MSPAMRASFLLSAVSAFTPLSLTTLERLSFRIDREREGLLRRVRQRAVGGDPLSNLTPERYVLAPGSA